MNATSQPRRAARGNEAMDDDDADSRANRWQKATPASVLDGMETGNLYIGFTA
jgi:hypothetical protein